MALKTSEITVTPKMAADWLNTHNTHNRPLRNSRVEELADQMRRGLWVLNGEAIIFDKENILADGQHRLYACIEADKPFKTVLVEGVSKEAFATIDTGSKRSAADVLHISGVRTNTNTLASAANLALTYKKGELTQNKPIPRSETLKFVNAHPELAEWVAAAKCKGWTNQYAAAVSAVAYLASYKYPHKAKDFIRKFTTGEELKLGDPVLTLRNRLGTEKRMAKSQRMALIALAWNAYVDNRALHKMQSPRSESFPKILGAEK